MQKGSKMTKQHKEKLRTAALERVKHAQLGVLVARFLPILGEKIEHLYETEGESEVVEFCILLERAGLWKAIKDAEAAREKFHTDSAAAIKQIFGELDEYRADKKAR